MVMGGWWEVLEDMAGYEAKLLGACYCYTWSSLLGLSERHTVCKQTTPNV